MSSVLFSVNFKLSLLFVVLVDYFLENFFGSVGGF